MLRTVVAILLAVTFVPASAAAPAAVPAAGAAAAGVPSEEKGFGSNPGKLQMFRYAPAGLPAGAPVVVALHGCGQSGSGYGADSGWVGLADQRRFALLLPQKPNQACFGWYDQTATSRGQGEALSVRQMVDRMLVEYGADPRRVYLAGFSAGGAMAAALLAVYPDLFVAGAIVAGLPYRCADTLIAAFSCMNPGVDRSPKAWGDAVRAAAPGYPGPWPPVSLWQGTADYTVAVANQAELLDQWTDVQGVDETPEASDTVAGYPHAVYRDAAGRSLVETYRITGMPHGQPTAPGCGRASTYTPDKGICAAAEIARFWSL
jgi:poly(hydroxyalkanoate) depolymerase family esterase